MSKCKYYLEKEVVSYDGGITWNETGVTRRGNLYEEGSEDCTDPSVQYRWINMDVATDYICDGTNKYYKQKKQVSYDGIIWQDASPAEYQRGSIYEVNSPDCQPTYRWVNMDITTDYICDETTYTKYYKQKKQVSYGGQEWQDVIPYEYKRGDVYETESTDCGYVAPLYRWTDMDIATDYICDGTTKYYKQKKQVSYDEGQTWEDVTPAEYQRGDVYETQSLDCGYVPPTVSKFQATYSGGQTYEKECNGNTTLMTGDTKPSGYEYSAMTSAVIGNCVTEIGSGAFLYCSGLTSVTIPNSVTSIGWGAFQHCSSLTGVAIPDSVTSIDQYAFSFCSGFTGNLNIPNSVTSIGANAFWECNRITGVTIPDSITVIEESVFSHCSGLTSVVIPDSVTSISNAAFDHCTSLTGITIPNSVTSIGAYALRYCSFASIVIPSGITSINDNTFDQCYSLTSIVIPDGVTSIGTYAFHECHSLTSIVIPSGVTSIGYGAFSACTSLTGITVEVPTPPAIERYAFANTNNCPIYVPASSVEAYKSASGWSSYSSRIQAIP